MSRTIRNRKHKPLVRDQNRGLQVSSDEWFELRDAWGAPSSIWWPWWGRRYLHMDGSNYIYRCYRKPPRWFRNMYQRKSRRYNQQDLHRWIRNEEHEVMPVEHPGDCAWSWW